MSYIDALVVVGRNLVVQQATKNCPIKICKGCDFPPIKSSDCAYHCVAWEYWKERETQKTG